MPGQSKSAFAGTLTQAVREAHDDLKRHKRAVRDHRYAAREAAAKLARLKEECARRGIALMLVD